MHVRKFGECQSCLNRCDQTSAVGGVRRATVSRQGPRTANASLRGDKHVRGLKAEATSMSAAWKPRRQARPQLENRGDKHVRGSICQLFYPDCTVSIASCERRSPL